MKEDLDRKEGAVPPGIEIPGIPARKLVKNIVNTDTATSRVPQDGEFKFQLNAVSAHDSDGNAISVNDMPMPAGSQNGTVTVTTREADSHSDKWSTPCPAYTRIT